jgi:hypothetical protein
VPTYSDSVRFDSIVVLESLPFGEQKTGTWLYDNVLKPWADAHPPFRVYFNAIDSKSQFLAALDAAEAQLFQNGSVPILHIEAHGDKEGIALSNGEHVRWEELRERLTLMNQVSGLNLLVVMAMCRGWWISQLLYPLRPSPAWGIIGPTEDVWDTDLRNAMEAFYRELLNSFNARAALDEMNKNKPYEKWEFILETAEVMYCRVFNHSVNVLCTPDQLSDRENEIVAEIVRRNNYHLEVAYDARDRARHMLADHRQVFDFYRHSFFMLDSKPENASRFKLSYDDCMAV